MNAKDFGFELLHLKDMGDVQRRSLAECHLISRDLMRNPDVAAVLLNQQDAVSVMMNEEDHLRIQAIRDGMALQEAADAGVKVQAVYMAAAAMGLSCVARTGFDREKVDALLRLGAEETAVAIATLGYRPNSILDAIR